MTEIHLKEMFFHYNVGEHKGGVLCPKRNFGDECPICEFASSSFGARELTTTTMRARSLQRASLCAPATSRQSLCEVEKKKELRCTATVSRPMNFFLDIFSIQNTVISQIPRREPISLSLTPSPISLVHIHRRASRCARNTIHLAWKIRRSHPRPP